MEFKTDIEIAQSTPMKHITEIARVAGVEDKYLELYGSHKAKVDYRLLRETPEHSGKLILSLVLCVAWIAMSVQAGTYQLDIWIVLLQLLAGLMTTFGGRRTEAGRHLLAEVLGFRLYLQTIPRVQLQHIRRQNPEYFHSLAPYAMALGCDQTFIRRFGRDLQPPCPYIVGVPQKPMTAAEWHKIFRRIARSMEARMRQMPVEKVAGFFRSLTR